jgi:hypothetical protein
MEEKFRKIKEEYANFYNSILREGKLPMRDTEVGFWGTAAADDVFELFRKINLGKYRHFIDLGSGDGKVVLIASLFTKAAGIEYDKELHGKAVEIRDRLGINAGLMRGDFLEMDISKHDIVFINPDRAFHRGVEQKLRKELKGTLVVYNLVYQPSGMKKGRTYWVGKSAQTPATLYTLK